uniref:Putative lipocalin-6 1 n=1 Tax=Amblyomma triste TaxID=251400 RepID=A0A023GBD9_AMBTT
MSALSWLMFLAHLIKVFGAETALSSSSEGTSGNGRDGFQILEVEVNFRLARTTFRSLSSSIFRCIITKTTRKDKAQHQVTELVRYMLSDSFTHTYSFTQSFQFSCEGGGYNKMASTDNTTVPHASYRFLSADPACVVLQYLSAPDGQDGQDLEGTDSGNTEPQNENQKGQDREETNSEKGQPQNENQKGEAQTEARDPNTDRAKQAPLDCMLWVQGIQSEPSTECEEKFKTLCGGIPRQSFSVRGCDALYNVVKYELPSAAENLEDSKEKTCS